MKISDLLKIQIIILSCVFYPAFVIAQSSPVSIRLSHGITGLKLTQIFNNYSEINRTFKNNDIVSKYSGFNVQYSHKKHQAINIGLEYKNTSGKYHHFSASTEETIWERGGINWKLQIYIIKLGYDYKWFLNSEKRFLFMDAGFTYNICTVATYEVFTSYSYHTQKIYRVNSKYKENLFGIYWSSGLHLQFTKHWSINFVAVNINRIFSEKLALNKRTQIDDSDIINRFFKYNDYFNINRHSYDLFVSVGYTI